MAVSLERGYARLGPCLAERRYIDRRLAPQIFRRSRRCHVERVQEAASPAHRHEQQDLRDRTRVVEPLIHGKRPVDEIITRRRARSCGRGGDPDFRRVVAKPFEAPEKLLRYERP